MQPKSPMNPRRQVVRTISAPPGKTSSTPPSTTMTRRRKDTKTSRKNSTDSRTSSIGSRMSDDDSNDSSQFSLYAKSMLHEKGIIHSKEDEKVINTAIEKIMLETSEEDITNTMMVVVDGSENSEEQEQRNPERFKRLRELANFDYSDVTLDDINMAADDVLDEFQKEDSFQSETTGDQVFEVCNEVDELKSDCSNQSGHLTVYNNEEDTRHSTDTFYSLKEESEEDKDESKSSESFSFERSFNVVHL